MKPETQAKPNSPLRLPLQLAGGLLLAFTLPSVFAAEAASRIYKCTDAKGKVYVTQTPPPECLGRPTDVLNKRGTVVQRDEGILTEQQIAQREAEKKKKMEQEAAAKEERRRATALLNTYSSEKDVEEARARALKENEDAIVQTGKKIADVLKRQKDLASEKEFYAKKAPPAKLVQDIQQNEIDLKNQQELLEAKKKQVATINAKYDDDKRRYIELTKNLPKR
jgi:hypothetical protein